MTTTPPLRTATLGESAVARQPIYDRQLNVVAYELLFRKLGDAVHAQIGDPDEATSATLMNAFAASDLKTIVSGRLALVNVTRSFLLQDFALLAGSDQMGLELLENETVDEALLAALGRHAAAGYVIALDDFVYREELKPALELAHVVKLDALALGEQGLVEQVAQLAPYKVWLLAEKVESHEEFELCMNLGFTHFQGHFFCKPKLVESNQIGASQLAKLQLVASIQKPSLQLEELEEIIGRDIGLSYRLLRYINSAFFSLRRPVDSIRDAMMVVGQRRVQSWATLIVLADIKPRPSELFVTAMLRGKMCELAAIASALAHPDTPGADTFFTTGLFSVIDALMDVPMEEVLAKLPFSEEIVDALLGGEGPLADVLRAVIAYTQGDFDAVEMPGLESPSLGASYLEAVAWADETSGALAP